MTASLSDSGSLGHPICRKKTQPIPPRLMDRAYQARDTMVILSRFHSFHNFVACLLALSLGSVFGEEPTDQEPSAAAFAPEPVTEEDFAMLKSRSPFLRPLDLSQSLVLTGLANVEGQLIATLWHRETKETHVVSASENEQGWKLMGVEGDRSNLAAMSAQISVGGGEVVAIRFDTAQLEPARVGPQIPPDQVKRFTQEARNYRRGISGDGHSGAPPKELADRLSKLSEDQRSRLIYQIELKRRQGVSSEDRRALFDQMVNQELRQRR